VIFTVRKNSTDLTKIQVKVLSKVAELEASGMSVVTARNISLPTTSECIRTTLHTLLRLGHVDRPVRGGYVVSDKGRGFLSGMGVDEQG